MPKPGSLLVVHLIEDHSLGIEFERSKWPLHVTLIPWFNYGDETKVVAQMQVVAKNNTAFKAEVGEQAMFGPQKNIPVNVFTDQTRLKELHGQLTSSLEQIGVNFEESHWMGQSYRPHVTRQKHGNRHKNAGDFIKVDNFYLVRLTSLISCKLLHKFQLYEAAA